MIDPDELAKMRKARADLAKFRPALEDPIVVRRCRQLSAAAVRARRYIGTPRGRVYTWGIGIRLAELVNDVVERYHLAAHRQTVKSLIEHVAFDTEVTVHPDEIA